MKPKNFSFALSANNKGNHSIEETLRHLTSYIKNEFGNNIYVSEICVNGLPFISGITADHTTYANISVHYWLISKKDLREHAEDQEYFKENSWPMAVKRPNLVESKPSKDSPIGFAEKRLATPTYPANIVQLLTETADYIKSLGDVTVLDLVYHDFLNADVLQDPSIRFYYTETKNIKHIFNY